MPTKRNDFDEILSVQGKRNDELLDKNNVLATALGYKNIDGKQTDVLCLKVYVEGKIPKEEKSRVPKKDFVDVQYDGVPTDIEEMEPCFATNKLAPPTELITEKKKEIEYETPTELGEIEAAPFTLRGRVRPVMGGYSIGHPKVSAGTLGMCVRDRFYGSTNRHFYVLSNNHVLANCNDADIGDPILQPARIDGGQSPWNDVAWLSNYKRIDFSHRAHNLIDAAIARIDFSKCNREIYWIGYVKAMMSRHTITHRYIQSILERKRFNVQKTGRTTDYTVGWIDGINATVNVHYPNNRTARFVDQIIISPGGFSDYGDSGSIITDIEENALGLLFAGSRTHTVANHIEHVANLMRIVISEKTI